MRHKTCAAAVILSLCHSLPMLAQSSDPAAANRALIGEGPNVTVQQSAIGTLDIGGPGAANPRLTGENLRGNLGASTSPSAAGTLPSAPNVGVPNFSFQAPNFGPDLNGAVPGRTPTKQELRVAEDLILPRYRAKSGDSTLRVASAQQADGWRYRYFNGRWWYWRSNETWAYWNGSEWRESVTRN